MKDPKIEAMRHLEVFAGCDPRDLRRLARVADVVDVPAGRVLAERGESVREFVVLLEGTAEARDGAGRAVLGPGAFYGEMGLIDGRPQTLRVQTLSPARVLVLDARAFRGMLERVPAVSRRLLGEMVERLRGSQDRSLRAAS